MSQRRVATDLAEFVVGLLPRDVPDLAVQRAVDAMIDCLGCALAGSREPLAPMIRKAITTVPEAHPTAVPLLGSADYAGPGDAALYNGTLSHAIDFDDITHPAYAHPTAVLLPCILSLARPGSSSGMDAVLAYVIGLEVFGRLGRALNTYHYRSGWHATSTFGSIAAAAAGARMLKLDVDRTRHALAIGGSASSGLRANFGTMTKPLHAGYAARNGVLAAQLAAEGFTANENILGADFGFAKTFNQNGEHIQWDELHRWGDELEILSEFGLALKPYPSCGATHPSIEAAILLHRDIGGRYREVAAVDVGVPDMAFQPLIYPNPTSPLQGKFSMQYVVAAALKHGDVSLQTFTEARLADPETRALMSKVTMKADERVQDNSEFGCVVELRLADGRRFTREVPLAIGKPDRWFPREMLHQKFLSCVDGILDPVRAEALFDEWLTLPSAERLGDLIARLAVSSASRSASNPQY
jgi:2-methylcitrate dehydratase PrpD